MKIEIVVTPIRDVTVIKPEDGMWLANEKQTIVSREIWLARDDSPENYHEVDEQTADEIRAKNLI